MPLRVALTGCPYGCTSNENRYDDTEAVIQLRSLIVFPPSAMLIAFMSWNMGN
ncbi:MAG: hypothetical protein V7K38_15220 [Nostoc sp.]|uniref:hypothetical protein n=1 Tax=Nostoc sp. TaxID=1180 RepID=UPI002FF4977E